MHYDSNHIRLNFNTVEPQTPAYCKLFPSRIPIAFIVKENPRAVFPIYGLNVREIVFRIPVAKPSLGRFGPVAKQPLWSLKLNSGNQHV
jgi:hypothetical protein